MAKQNLSSRKSPARRKGRRSRRNTVRWLSSLFVALAAVFAFAVSAFGGQNGIPGWNSLYQQAGVSNGSPALAGDGSVSAEPTKIHFIDVGQGDAVLIEQDGEYGMIDCGTPDCKTELLSYLDQLGVKELKVLIMTHPHADHIGSMAAVLQNCTVDQLVLPKLELAAEYPTSSTFAKVLDAAEAGQVPTTEAEIGQTYAVGSGTLTVISTGVASDNYNNISVCTMFTAGDFRFLDTGDAEKEVENALLESGTDLSATVFKAGHHGSRTANTLDFLQAVRPEAVVASCGLDNDYGHPHEEALEHFAAVGAAVYRTDKMGSVVAGYAPDTGLKLYTTKQEEAQAA